MEVRCKEVKIVSGLTGAANLGGQGCQFLEDPSAALAKPRQLKGRPAGTHYTTRQPVRTPGCRTFGF